MNELYEEAKIAQLGDKARIAKLEAAIRRVIANINRSGITINISKLKTILETAIEQNKNEPNLR